MLVNVDTMFDELREGKRLKRDDKVRGEVTSHGGTCDWGGEMTIDARGQGGMLDPRGCGTKVKHANKQSRSGNILN